MSLISSDVAVVFMSPIIQQKRLAGIKILGSALSQKTGGGSGIYFLALLESK
jgi:hypothetical protein